MLEDDTDEEVLSGALVHLVDYKNRERDEAAEVQEKAEKARLNADAARLALADLAAPAVAIIALRLHGEPLDWDGRPVTDEREETAWELLSRIGIPRLRATAVAASIAAQSVAPAPGSPGWAPPEKDDDEDQLELDPASVDAQIDAFLQGARTAQEARGA